MYPEETPFSIKMFPQDTKHSENNVFIKNENLARILHTLYKVTDYCIEEMHLQVILTRKEERV